MAAKSYRLDMSQEQYEANKKERRRQYDARVRAERDADPVKMKAYRAMRAAIMRRYRNTAAGAIVHRRATLKWLEKNKEYVASEKRRWRLANIAKERIRHKLYKLRKRQAKIDEIDRNRRERMENLKINPPNQIEFYNKAIEMAPISWTSYQKSDLATSLLIALFDGRIPYEFTRADIDLIRREDLRFNHNLNNVSLEDRVGYRSRGQVLGIY